MYSQKVLKHFENPHNQGKIDEPSIIGKAGSSVCGDTMNLYLKIDKDIIEDIKFETLGCAAAIASSSAFTDMVKGKTIDEAEKIKKEDVIKNLGGLPEHKAHCSLLAVDALKNAIEKYKNK